MRQALHIMVLYETGLTVCVMAHCAVVRVCVRPFSLKLQYACIQPGLTECYSTSCGGVRQT